MSALYAWYYWSIYGWRPGIWQALGYQSWADQSSYLIELRYLAQFRLPATPEEYLRGLGYPLVGVPFEWMGFREDPLLPANLILLAVTIACTFVAARRLSSSTTFAYVVCGVLVFASPLVELVIVPWSTTVTLAAMAIGILIATSPKAPTTWGAAGFGMLIGWTFAARFLDVVAIGLLGLWYLTQGGGAGRLKRTVVMALPALGWLLAVGLSQLAVHGSFFATGYTRHNGNPQSLEYYNILRVPRTFWETFVTGIDRVAGRSEMDPLFIVTPLLVLLPLGMWLVLRKGTPLRGMHIALIVGSLVQGSVYLAGGFSGAEALWYNSPRFWIASYPYWIILSLRAGVWLFRLTDRRTSEVVEPDPTVGQEAVTARAD